MASRVLRILVSLAALVALKVFCKPKDCDTGGESKNNTVTCSCENDQIISCLLTAKKNNPKIILYNVAAKNFSTEFKFEIPDNVKKTQDVPVSVSIGHMKDIPELTSFLQEVGKQLKITNLKITDMGSLDPEVLAADLATQSSASLESTELTNLFGDLKNKTQFDLGKFKTIRRSFEISGIETVAVTMPDPTYVTPVNLTSEIATKISLSTVSNVTGLVHIFLKEKEANETVIFSANGMFPRFYREDPSPKLKVRINLDKGANMMLKETFLYSGANINLSWDAKSKFLIPPSVLRVEFGTFFDGKEVRFLAGPNFPQNFSSLFTEGKCFELKGITNAEDLCEICYMHQYQLHRVEDKLEELCENGPKNEQNGTDEMKICYWQEVQKVPASLDQFKIDKTWIPEGVKVCDNITKDIEEFLDIHDNFDDSTSKTTKKKSRNVLQLFTVSFGVLKLFELIRN